MPEPQPTTSDEAGVTRTPTGEISSPSTSTPDTIVRPPPTPTKPEASAETTGKSDGARQPGKSLLNEKSPETGAPETYADFTVPEGFTLDKDVAGEFGAIAKKNNITQTGAQELVNLYVKLTQESHDAPFQRWQDTQDEWRAKINSDPEIGGSKLNATKASIGRLLDSLGDTALVDSFREAMDITGAGNNPAFVKFLARIAQRLTEGGPVRGGGPSPEGFRRPGEGAPSAAQAIYPNLPSNRG